MAIDSTDIFDSQWFLSKMQVYWGRNAHDGRVFASAKHPNLQYVLIPVNIDCIVALWFMYSAIRQDSFLIYVGKEGLIASRGIRFRKYCKEFCEVFSHTEFIEADRFDSFDSLRI